MEALSPRDANAQFRAKDVAAKAKAPTKPMGKEKDHPPPPPAEVIEPPSLDRKNGSIYRTGRCLGKGGFAICYEGRLAGTNKIYALKVVKSHMPQKKMEQKFQTELQIHAKMKHPNIVHFYRAFSYNKCTYIALELCPNGSLMDVVRRRRYVTEPEVRFYTVQIAGAIKYMHSRGIIHRDLKMGNIFLDKDMNVKVGDFGLAALLMSGKDMQACRRTTLCGTPNYIAPEILEKGKGGHDHTVDIWSLGIIIFALLTGKPPFQSASADEIYRRAKERRYDWPKLDTSDNFISEETKDLVAQLLQAPEERPTPDDIVQHPFFTCGWMPQGEEMTPDLRETPPSPSRFLTMGMRGGRMNLYTQNLKKLCIECEVGPWNTQPKRYVSIYKEVAAEEDAGLTPVVPLAEDKVYRPFDEWLKHESERVFDESTTTVVGVQLKLADILSVSKRKEKPGASSSRPTAQSFAAQQRARPQASTTRAAKSNKVDAESKSNSKTTGSNEPTPGALITVPRRHMKSTQGESEVKHQEPSVEGRLAAEMVEQLSKIEVERKSDEKPSKASQKIRASIFNSKERLEPVPDTKPDVVMDRLYRMLPELERVLNTRSMALNARSPWTKPMPIVVKWVDYSNKFGLGYILSDGSVGSIFRPLPANSKNHSKGLTPPTSILIRDGEQHIARKEDSAYPDRCQIVPISGYNIEFYENRGPKGTYKGYVNPANYKVEVKDDDMPEKLTRGKDEWDDRKRERIVLWKKFGSYMASFGREEDYLEDDLTKRKSSGPAPPGHIISFYQRFGDVGVWGFADGRYQFNFPDHTKIVISADATWCDFYHLPLEAARDLSIKGSIPVAALDDRQCLSYPIQTLLNFMAKPNPRAGKATTRRRPEIDPMIQGIPGANDFRRKIEFIKFIVKEWVSNEGIGISAMEPDERLKWQGYREKKNVNLPLKHVWITIGGHGDDSQRRMCWYNPNKPDAEMIDVEF